MKGAGRATHRDDPYDGWRASNYGLGGFAIAL
jgi:hypothetical protein